MCVPIKRGILVLHLTFPTCRILLPGKSVAALPGGGTSREFFVFNFFLPDVLPALASCKHVYFSLEYRFYCVAKTAASRLVMFANGHMQQTLPPSCERSHGIHWKILAD